MCNIAPKGLNCGCENYVAPGGAAEDASTDTSVVSIVANQSALSASVASPPSLVPEAALNVTGGADGLQRACRRTRPCASDECPSLLMSRHSVQPHMVQSSRHMHASGEIDCSCC